MCVIVYLIREFFVCNLQVYFISCKNKIIQIVPY